MADDKIVTKKTAAKRALIKKTTTLKGQVPGSVRPPAASADMTKSAASKAPTKKVAARATGKKAASPATAPAVTAPPKRRKVNAQAAAAPSPSGHQGPLHELATVSEEKRRDMIREAAYYKAEKRHFAPGHEAEDWAAAEREIDELIARARAMTGH